MRQYKFYSEMKKIGGAAVAESGFSDEAEGINSMNISALRAFYEKPSDVHILHQ